MWGKLCDAIHVVQSMWCELRGVSYVVGANVPIYVTCALWCKLRGAIYVVGCRDIPPLNFSPVASVAF